MANTTPTGRFRSTKRTYWDRETGLMRDVIHPQFETEDFGWVFIQDVNTKSGEIECGTRKEARKIAEEVMMSARGKSANEHP